jgi:ATP-dependent protease ClpP protease subunit
VAPVEIFIYDRIGVGSAAAIVQQIREAGKKPIKVRINSPGGDVFEGYAIYNALLAHVPGE